MPPTARIILDTTEITPEKSQDSKEPIPDPIALSALPSHSIREPRKFCVIDMRRQYEVGRLSQE